MSKMNIFKLAIFFFVISFVLGLGVLVKNNKEVKDSDLKEAFKRGWNYGFSSCIYIQEETGNLGNPKVNYNVYQEDSTNYFNYINKSNER